MKLMLIQRQIYVSLIIQSLRHPVRFIKSFNLRNYKRLLVAVKTEPPEIILCNMRSYFSRKTPKSLRQKTSEFISEVKKQPSDKTTVLFISHEATRTGAPLIILKLAQGLAKNHGISPVFICCKGGEISSDFTRHFPTYFLSSSNLKKIDDDISYLIKKLYDLGINSVFVNSAESRFTLPLLRRAGFEQIIALIHEMGNFYPVNSWGIIDQYSNHVVFPTRIIKEVALQNYSFRQATLHTVGQGLLKPEIFSYNHSLASKIIRLELNLEPDSLIVLGCGTPIERKGTDIFIFTAISVLRRYHNKRPVYFIWIGDSPKNSFKTWIKRDLKSSGLSDRIKLIGTRENVIPYFAGSNLFLLTSRGDPYPCVVHEALAAGLPIVGFYNSGGLEEMIYKKNGHLHPYGDIAAAASNIIDLLSRPADLRKYRQETIEFAKRTLDFDGYVAKIFRIFKTSWKGHPESINLTALETEKDFILNPNHGETLPEPIFEKQIGERTSIIKYQLRNVLKSGKSEVFIVRGYAKSGTNWLGNLLNLHPAVSCRGEFHLEHLFEGFIKTHANRWGLIRRNPELLNAAFYTMIEQLIIDECQHAPLCGDRTPAPINSSYLPGRKCLYITRDGRDVMVSWAFHALRNKILGFQCLEHKHELFSRDPDYYELHKSQLLDCEEQVRTFAHQWNTQVVSDFNTMEAADKGEIALPYLWVRYEDLHQDLSTQIKRIFNFLDLSIEDLKPLDRYTSPGFGRIDNRSFFRRGESGVWPEYFTAEQLRWFEEEAAEGLALVIQDYKYHQSHNPGTLGD